MSNDLINLVVHADSMVKFVMLLLLFFSIVTWAIVLVKFEVLRRARKESVKFLEIFWSSRRFDLVLDSCKSLSYTPLAEMFKAGYMEFTNFRTVKQRDGVSEKEVFTQDLGGIENIRRALNRAALQESSVLEKWISFLATTGSTAPFIGLFGTVWGIMTSFINIGATKDTSLAVVAPGISEALIATAMGLFAAIPAVVFYNVFVSKIRGITNEMENFSSDFLNIMKRQFF